MKQQELEDLVKQVYFYCENKDPQGLYPDEVDLIEYTSRLLAVWEAQKRATSPEPSASVPLPVLASSDAPSPFPEGTGALAGSPLPGP